MTPRTGGRSATHWTITFGDDDDDICKVSAVTVKHLTSFVQYDLEDSPTCDQFESFTFGHHIKIFVHPW